MKLNKILRWLPVIAWMAVIFMFSAQPAEVSSETSSLPAEILAKIIKPNFDSYTPEYQETLLNNCQFVVRKLAHFSVYTILGILSSIAFSSVKSLSSKMKLISPAVLCLIYAVSDEIHQYFVPGRSCRFMDIAIDFSGALFGLLLFVITVKLYVKIRKK